MNSSTPGDERRASSLSLDSATGFARRLFGRIESFFSSPRWVWWGGVSFVVAGFVGISAFLLDIVVIRCELFIGQQAYGCGGGFQFLSDVSRGVGTLLIAFGILGLYTLPTECPKPVKRLAGVGVVLVAFFAIIWVGLFAREPFPQPFYIGYTNFFPVASPLNGVQLLGMLFVCVSALWSRGLGVWRWLPLGIWLSVAFLPQIFWLTIWLAAPGADEVFFVNGLLMTNGTIFGTVVFQLPQIIASLGWILVGAVMFGAKEREARIISKEKRETEARNLALARRLYEEAWGNKNLSVVDEIASDDFFDKRRNRNGASPFKQAISDLHHAFPDLKAEIAEQTAEGDTVTTRIAFSGTDKGGVLWYPPTDKTATFVGTFTDRFEDGKLVEHDGEMDEESLIEQLGLPSEK